MLKHPLLYVWIVLAGMFLASGLIRPASEGPHVGQARAKAQSAKDGDRRAGIAPAPTRQQGEPNCDEAGDKGDYSLCLQRRATEAAEWLNVINWTGLGVLAATLIAAFVAAVAAWQTVRTMRDTAKRELRAYINLDMASFSIDAKGEFMFKARFKNYGQTPAHNVTSTRGYKAFGLPFEGAPDLSTIDEPNPAGTIGPGTEIKLENWMPRLSEADHERLTRRQWGIFYFGRITYVDAFGESRFTDFCQFVVGRIGEGTDEMLTHPFGNDAT